MLELLEKTILENITLHKQLRWLIRTEKILFSDNKLDDVKISAVQRTQIEAKIQDGNTNIESFFNGVASGKIVISEAHKTTLAPLINELRNSVINTINISDQTGKELQKQKNTTLKDLKAFGRGKKALKSYTQNTQLLQ